MFKKTLVFFLAVSTIFWSLGPVALILPLQNVFAATTVTVVPLGEPNNPIKASSAAAAIAKISVVTDQANKALQSVKVSFSADPTTKLATMATGATSGLALYGDGGSTAGSFDGTDSIVILASAPSWDGGTSSFILTPASGPSLTQGGTDIFYAVIKTSSSLANGDNLIATVPTNGVVTDDSNGPSANTALYVFLGDTNGPFVEEVVFNDSTRVDVRFNKKLDATTSQTASNYTLSTADAGDTETISSAVLQPDNRTVRITASSAVISSAGTDTITANSSVLDKAGNANAATAAIFIMSGFQPMVISEIQTSGATSDDEFIELYNRSVAAVNLNTMGLKLHIVSADGATDTSKTLTFVNNSVPSNGFFLITPAAECGGGSDPCYDGSVTADATYSGAAIVDNGGVYISLSSTTNVAVMDKVGWGTQSVAYEGQAASSGPAANGSLERKAHPQATSATMASGGADVTNGNEYDTESNSFDFVVQTAAVPQNSSSTAETAGGGGANAAPNIMHSPLFKAQTGSSLSLVARMSDTGGTLSNSNTFLYYCGSGSGAACDQESEFTSINGVDIGAGWFKFVVPSSALNASNDLRYFLAAKDNSSTPLMSVFTSDPGYDTATFSSSSSTPGDATAVKALVIDMVSTALGSATVSGTVQDSGSSAIADAAVFIEGTPFVATTLGDGTFSISNAMPGFFNLTVTKQGYRDHFQPGLSIGSSGTTAVGTVTLSTGQVGAGGDFSKPEVVWTAPDENTADAPTDISISSSPILVSFSKEMDSTTINSTNVTLKKIIFASDGSVSTQTISASVGYEAASADLTVSGQTYNFGDESKAVIYSPTALSENVQYVVSIRNVKDTAGNALPGNRPNGEYGFMFSTSANVNIGGGGSEPSFGQASGFPPFVMGVMPQSGIFNIPLNTKIIVKFSERMDSSTINSTNLKLFPVTNPFTPTESVGSAVSLSSVSIDTVTESVAILTPAANLTSSTNYIVRILGGVKSKKGVTMAPPGMETNEMFRGDFTTGTATDSTAPTVNGTYPSSGATSVPVNLGNIDVSFSDNMDPSTITKSSVQLKFGSTAVSTTIDYDPMDRTARISPKSAFTPGATYTIAVSIAVKDIAGNALAAASNSTFTVSSQTDSTAPTLMFANADDFSLAITFSEPMKALDALDTGFAASVKKLGNYTLKTAAAASDPSAGTAINLAALMPQPTLEYDAFENTVIIKGIADPTNWVSGKEFYVEMANVTDPSGNAIDSAAKSAMGTIRSMSETGGALGPGGPMMSGSATDGFSASTMFDTAKFTSSGIGFVPPVNVFPFNTIGGMTTIYGVEIPISKQIDAGGTIVLTFPNSFDISGAKKDVNSPPNNDINGPHGPGVVVFAADEDASLPTGAVTGGSANDGVYAVTSSNTVTVKLGAVATRSESGDTFDFLRFDVDGIVNSSIPKDFTTSGYTIDIKTKKADGTTLESFTSQPIFISSAGSSSLSGTITATGATGSTMKVYLGSPMTGPMDATSATFSSGAATYSFSSIPDGEYMLFTDPYITLTGGSFSGLMPPINVSVSGSATKDFSIISDSTGVSVTVNIVGTFTNEDIDIFAGSPFGFRVKTVNLNGTFTSGSPSVQTINLNSDGNWFVGIGPAMPKGPMGGPPPMPDWIVPQPEDVQVSSCSSTCSASPSTLTFTTAISDKTVNGKVVDASGLTMGNVGVYAYSPTGGFGTGTETKSDGTFQLKLVEGSFVVGSFLPGMPSSREISIVIKGSKIYIDGATTGIDLPNTASTLQIKIVKPDYTISGKVTDGTNVISGAGVFAYRTDGPGNADAMTGSDGSYTLYVANGTWKVGVFLPSYGQLPEKTVVISSADKEDLNFAPDSQTTFYTVSGTVFQDSVIDNNTYDFGEGIAGAFVKIEGSGNFNDTMTDSNGDYSVKVPAGTYAIRVFAHGYGEMPPLTGISVSANLTGQDFKIESANKITVNIKDGGGTAVTIDGGFVDFFDTSTKTGNGLDLRNISSASLNLPDGSYTILAHIPGAVVGSSDIQSDSGSTTVSSGVLTVDGDETIKIVLANFRTVSGTVYASSAASGNELANAWVQAVDPSTGVQMGAQADSSGAYSLKLADGTYSISALKPGYFDTPQTLVVAATMTLDGTTTASNAINLVVGQASATITGQILVGSSGAANAFVRAEKLGGEFTGAQADSDGNYTLSVTDGDWRVFAVADGYAEAAYSSNPVTISGSSVSGINITLSSTVTLTSIKTKPMTPSNGGTFNDSNAGVIMEVPANALGTSNSSAQISVKETNNIRDTASTSVIGGLGKEIKAYDSDNNPITTLNDSVELEFEYAKTKLGSFDTKTEVDKLNLGSWNESTQEWESLPTVITYKDSSGDVVTSPQEDLSNVSTITLKGKTLHFSLFAPISPTDPSAPSAPTGLSVSLTSSQDTDLLDLSWTANSESDLAGYYIYRSTDNSSYPLRATITSGSTVTHTDTSLDENTKYYYKITAYDNSGNESAATSAVNTTTPLTGSGTAYFASGGGSTTTTTTQETTQPTTQETTQETTQQTTEQATSATQTTYQDGDLIRASDDSKVYVVKEGKKVWVPTQEAFDAGGYNWSDVKVVSSTATVASARLFRTAGDQKVYIIENDMKRHIPSPEVFNAYGYNWNDVVEVSADLAADYPAAKLVKAQGDYKVYLIENGVKTHIKTAEEFNNAGYKWTEVVEINRVEFLAYSDADIKTVDAKTLVRAIGDFKVYLIEGLKKRWIKSITAFAAGGYDWNGIKEISRLKLAEYGAGNDID